MPSPSGANGQPWPASPGSESEGSPSLCAAAGDPSVSAVEAALRQTRARLQAIFEGVETGIFLIDPEEHRIVDANPVALELVGAARGQVVGAVCHQFVCPAETGRCPVTDLGQTVDNSERVLLTAGGERRAIIKTVRPVSMEGRPFLLESFLDITGRRQAEQNLAERTAYLNTLIEISPLGIAVLDQEGRIQLSNSALERLFLYTREDMHQAPFHDLLVPADRIVEAEHFTEECLRGCTVHFLTRRRRRDGSLVDVEVYGVPVTTPGKPASILALYQDITARVVAEAEMEERHRLAALAAEVGLALTGAENPGHGLQQCADALMRNTDVFAVRIWSWNRHSEALESQAVADMQMLSGGRHSMDPARIERIARSGVPDVDEATGEAAAGDSFAGFPLRVRDQVLGVVAVLAGQPLTAAALQALESVAHSVAQFVDRRCAESSLRESEDRFRTAFEEAPYGMCMTAPDGHFLHANAALCRMLGYSAEELLAGVWQQVTHPDDLARCRDAAMTFSKGLATTLEFEKRYIHKEGQPIWARVRISQVTDGSGRPSHFITQIEDISERKLAEERLRASEESYRDLFENASDLVYTFDLDLRITSLNRLAEKTTGYSRQQAVGMSLRELMTPEQWDRVRVVMEKMLAGQAPAKFEVDLQSQDGRRVALEVNPRLIVRDGTPFGVQAIARDITGRDVAEMELRQAQKLESVGRLASGIAHEINTPMQFVADNVRFLQDAFRTVQELLTRIRAFCGRAGSGLDAEFLRLEQELDTAYLLREIPEALAQTQEGVERVVTIVRAMKEFAHPESRGCIRADLNKALLNTLTVARNELKYVADVETDLGELPMVDCSISDLNQVFLNLLVNAAHAIAEVVQQSGAKGRIRIRTESDRHQVLITIADNGAGIPEGIRDRIFDPFFTTKEVGRGTGQGLAIARTVVERHKGTLTFESEVGRGTTFSLRLPIESPEHRGGSGTDASLPAQSSS